MVWEIKKIDSLTEAEYEKTIENMMPSRRARIERIKHSARRRASVCAEYLVKNLLSKEKGISVEGIKIAETSLGAPYAEGLSVFLSISHSGEYAAVSVSDSPVGIDIERIRKIDLAVAEKFCSAEDLALLAGEAAFINFYKIWTAKEAYFKMKGTGLKNPKSISYNELNPQHYFEDGYIITIIN